MSADTKRWPRSSDPDTPTISEFCERHGLISELVPFAHREHNPWTLAHDLNAEFEELPTTAATLTTGDLLERITGSRGSWNGYLHTVLIAIGSWPVTNHSSRATRWANPYYPHQRALAPGGWGSRVEHLQECARIGVYDTADIAPRLDMSEGRLRGWLSENDIPWNDWRAEGRKRLGRTIRVTNAWTDRGIKDVSDLLPKNYTRVKKWAVRYAREDGWAAPEDPSLVGGETA